MSGQLPPEGTEVLINAKIAKRSELAGLFVHEKHFQARRPGAKGWYKGFVPGHGGDVWYVMHEDGAMGAYVYDELVMKGHPNPEHLLFESAAFEDRSVGAMPMEEMRDVIASVCDHLQLQVQSRRVHGDREYRVVPK